MRLAAVADGVVEAATVLRDLADWGAAVRWRKRATSGLAMLQTVPLCPSKQGDALARVLFLSLGAAGP